MPTTTFRALLLLVTLGPLALAAAVPRAAACPFCDGGPSGVNEVRDGIFNEDFWPRAAATLAPFPVLAGIVALIYFGPPGFRRPRHGAAAAGQTSSSQTEMGDLSCSRPSNSTAAR